MERCATCKKSLREWADIWEREHGIVIYDPDGFDRRDPDMWEREYTRDEFVEGLWQCTIVGPVGGER